MNRNDFGLWGANLSSSEFAQAIAALGVIWGENFPSGKTDAENNFSSEITARHIVSIVDQKRPLKWYLGYYWFNIELWQRELNRLPAPELAKTWQIVAENRGEVIGAAYNSPNLSPVRLEVNQDERIGLSTKSDVLWILEQLSHPKVRAASVYWFISDTPTNVVWDFPLRIGLLDDAESRELRKEIENLTFNDEQIAARHIKLIDIKAGNSDCDVLLLPHNLRAAVGVALTSPNALRADCVIVTGRVDETDERTIPLVESLRTQARAAGVCLVSVRATKIADEKLNKRQMWFNELIRQITQNQPIDIALVRASRDAQINVPPPQFFATPQLISASLISRRLDQFAEKLGNPYLRNTQVQLDDLFLREIISEKSNRVHEENFSLNEIGEVFRDSEREFILDEESDMATTYGDLKATAEAALETAPPPPPKSRWINTEIWEYRTGNRKRSVVKDSYLRSYTDYGIVVFIGSNNENSISASEPFNDEALSPGKNDHELTIVFTEPNVSPEPKVAKIVLPQQGNSSECEFFIRIPKKIGGITARIAVVYKNRILQTAILEASVLSEDEENKEEINIEKSRIELLIESPVRPGMQDLTDRQWFDAALILNHNQSGTPQMTKIVNDNAEFVSLADIEDRIEWFDDLISRISKDWKKFEKLQSKKSVELLRMCAINGAALYKGLMTGRNEDVLAVAERIQIISARNGSRLPLEFVYGRLAPDDDADLCPHAEKSLLQGYCDLSCAGQVETKTVCPLGFWGLNRVIERHAYDVRAAREMSGMDFALQTEPIENRKKLNVLTKAIVAASHNVDAVEAGSSQKVIDALNDATKKQTKSVGTWKDWLADVKERTPTLMVLIPHTLKDAGNGQATLEIGANERLIFSRLQKSYVLGPTDDPHPVVILMGCKTASPDIAYENFISEFRRMGAALVVGTGSTILGRHAAPVVSAFIKEIAEIGPGDTAFGDVMLTVRRKMMAQGLLMVLCLTSYGDTDWII